MSYDSGLLLYKAGAMIYIQSQYLVHHILREKTGLLLKLANDAHCSKNNTTLRLWMIHRGHAYFKQQCKISAYNMHSFT